jgi:hypothetical protein
MIVFNTGADSAYIFDNSHTACENIKMKQKQSARKKHSFFSDEQTEGIK